MTEAQTSQASSDYLKVLLISAACVSSFAASGNANPREYLNHEDKGGYERAGTSQNSLSFLQYHHGNSVISTAKKNDFSSLLVNLQSSHLSEAISIVRDLKNLEDGWDSEDGKAPKIDTIDDALIVLQNWSLITVIPEPALSYDGNISLEMYTKDGFALGGVELIGENKAIYTVISGQDVIASGEFNTKHQEQILKALGEMAAVL